MKSTWVRVSVTSNPFHLRRTINISRYSQLWLACQVSTRHVLYISSHSSTHTQRDSPLLPFDVSYCRNIESLVCCLECVYNGPYQHICTDMSEVEGVGDTFTILKGTSCSWYCTLKCASQWGSSDSWRDTFGCISQSWWNYPLSLLIKISQLTRSLCLITELSETTSGDISLT